MLAHLLAGDFHALHRSQTVADQFLQGPLQLRIALEPNLGGKAHDGGFTHAHGIAQLGGSHKGGLVVIFDDVPGNELLSL